MSLQTDIKWIKSELNQVRDPELIMAFKNLLKYRKNNLEKDWWDNISAEEKSEIEVGLGQAHSGELVSNEEALKNARKWG